LFVVIVETAADASRTTAKATRADSIAAMRVTTNLVTEELQETTEVCTANVFDLLLDHPSN
jgi:hypothetical protein